MRESRQSNHVVLSTAGRAGAIAALAIVWWLAPVGAARAGSAGAELVVFQAASLKDAFARLAQRFEGEHPGTKVVTNSAGSQELRAQIEHGASADVFASADRKHMDALVAEGLAADPAVFACNEPVVVVRTALASSLKGLVDLPRAERTVIGTPEVPIGAYSLQILRKAATRYGAAWTARVEANVASRELNVRQVLAKVVLGEADAGIVYRSDAVAAAGKVQVVAIPPELNVTAEYPLALLKHAPNPRLGQQWIDLVKSAAGVAALREAGFVPCRTP